MLFLVFLKLFFISKYPTIEKIKYKFKKKINKIWGSQTGSKEILMLLTYLGEFD